MEDKFIKEIDEAFGSLDTKELLRLIREYRRIDIRRVSDDFLLGILKNIIPAKITIASIFDHRNVFYRARKLKENAFLFEEEKDIWCPPVERISNLGRMNRERESFLYTSLDPIILVDELRLNPGDWFTLIKYGVKSGQTVHLNGIGMSEDDIPDTEPIFSDLFNKISIQAHHNYDIVKDFIRTEFTRDVGIGTEYLYRTSLLIRDYFFLDGVDADGFVYPSVASKGGINVAFKPDSVKSKLYFIGLRPFQYPVNSKQGSQYLISKDIWSNQISNNKIMYTRNNECPVDFGFSSIPLSVVYSSNRT